MKYPPPANPNEARYTRLVRLLDKKHPETNKEFVRRAVRLFARCHREQREQEAAK